MLGYHLKMLSYKSKELHQNCQETIGELQMLVCNMSIKLHFLHSHLAHYPENLSGVSYLNVIFKEHGGTLFEEIECKYDY